MTRRIVVLAAADLSPQVLADCKGMTAQFADYLGEPVTFAAQSAATLADATALLAADGLQSVSEIQPGFDLSAATMTSAEFRWRADGRPDWPAMWSSFCELALYGGAPHRGEENSLSASAGGPAGTAEFDAVAEIRRGIRETTGLRVEAAADGWLAVTCESPKMAAWLCAAIIMENVDARCDGARLLVPASAAFTLKDEVKSVITVVAKTNHYWEAHTTAVRRDATGAATLRDQLAVWWEQRQPLRANAWDVPFPPRPEEQVRVLQQRAGPETGGKEIWRAGLFQPGAMTAFLEVHSTEGPIGVLESLYQHTANRAYMLADGVEEE